MSQSFLDRYVLSTHKVYDVDIYISSTNSWMPAFGYLTSKGCRQFILATDNHVALAPWEEWVSHAVLYHLATPIVLPVLGFANLVASFSFLRRG